MAKPRSARFPLIVGFAAIGLLVGVFGVWGVQARIAGAIIATGLIEVESNRQVIQHPSGGVVGEILVDDGAAVEAGQIVLRLDDTLLLSELAIIEGQFYEILARKARLEAERDERAELNISEELAEQAGVSAEVAGLVAGQARLLAVRAEALQRELDQIDEQISQGRNQIQGVESQLEALDTQGELIESELEDSLALFEKGLVQASRVSGLQREKARILGETGRLNAAVAQLKGEIAALDIQRLKLATNRREDAITRLRDLQFQEIELTERRLAARETLARLEIRSPVAGVIHDSQVFALQSVISPAQPLMYVIPQDQPLIVSARIEAIHIDQVQVGQEASLRFTAFDQRLTPEVFGQISKVSADVFTDELTGLSYYRAELLPYPDELTKLEGQELLPGMPVEAFIKTDERSPLNYLAKPLLDYFNKAFRES